MLTRRAVLQLPLLSLIPSAGPAAEMAARRALLVGIDKYVPAKPLPQSDGAQASSRPAVQRGKFGDLDGAVNDATLIYHLLLTRFGFRREDIVFLRNQQATRARILSEFQRLLVTGASKGDSSFFYYAGHGSQVPNLASDEADQLDETLVPADIASGVRDIRDKEMARLYRAALEKGVSLTVVLDSCYSGGMSRGAWNASGKVRYAPPDPRPVNDPDRDSAGKKLPDPAAMGMLFLGAAREDQQAGETTVTERGSNGASREISHGAFTAALARVLETPMATQSIAQICGRVEAIMASQGKVQVPICAGTGRQSRGLFGQPAGLGAALTVAVDGISGAMVRFAGGSALGLAPGCTLVRTDGRPVRMEVTRVEVASSEAKLPPGLPLHTVKPGDLFKLETWVAPPDAAIRLYFPKDGPDEQAVLQTARAIAKTNIPLLSDIGGKPTHVLYWRDAEFVVERYPASGDPIKLGASPTADAITAAMAGVADVRLWPIFPPSRQFAAQLTLGEGTANAAIRTVANPADCIYFLAGRLSGDALEYAWVLKDATVVDPNHSRYPLRTDWKTAAADLTGLALRLGRIYAWLNLDGPAGGDDSFPYHLTFEKQGAADPRTEGAVHYGEKYKFVLAADPEALKQADARGGVLKHYIYIFLIDSTGEAQCFFPNPANGNDGNLIPRGDTPLPRVEATRLDHDVEIGPPEGTDNYFMLASREPLDPAIFEWSGVRTRAVRGGSNPLQFLFGSIGTGTRGGMAARAVPVTWSIQSVPVRCTP